MSEQFQPQTGDIYLIRSSGLVGKLVRILISIRYGIPYKDAHSHIEIGYDSTHNFSAEPSGAKLKKNDRLNKNCDYKVYRLNNFDQEKQEKHKKISEGFIGKGYAYARFALDTLRIVTFFVLILGMVSGLLGMTSSLAVSQFIAFGSAVLFVLSIVVQQVLAKKDMLTHDCTELTSLVLAINGLWIPTVKSRNEFPDGMKQVLDNMVLHGGATVVYEKYHNFNSSELNIAPSTV